jgi:UDP-N-acetylmuramoyl-L-alanyl-D-glutamate--2,6-diaminopimelate ligase
VTRDQIVDAINALTPVLGRMQRVSETKKTGPAVFVDYAHTPDALEKALRTLRAVKGAGALHVVFGCGGNRDAGKRPLMGRVAESVADYVCITSDNPRGETPATILAEVQAGLQRPGNASVIEDRALAIRTTIGKAKAEDIVLIAGKGHETTQEIAGKHFGFNDAHFAAEALCSR